MRFWKMLIFWFGQLVIVGGFFQVVAWLYAVSDAVEAAFASHRDWVTLALIVYFACFAVWYAGSGEASKTQKLAREADDER